MKYSIDHLIIYEGSSAINTTVLFVTSVRHTSFLAVSATLAISQRSSADRATTPSQQLFVVERSPSRVRWSGYSLPEFLR